MVNAPPRCFTDNTLPGIPRSFWYRNRSAHPRDNNTARVRVVITQLGTVLTWAVRLLLGVAVLLVAGFVLAVLLVTFEGRNAFPAPLRADAAVARHMPDFRYREAYEVGVNAEPEEVFDAIRRADLSSVPVLRLFLELRDAPARAAALMGRADFRRPSPLTLDSLAAVRGFQLLEEQPGRSVVLGSIRRIGEGSVADVRVEPAAFNSFAAPGHVKVVVSVEALPRSGGGTRLALEWRALGTEVTATRRLARYWMVARPFTQMVARTGLPRLALDADSAASTARRQAARTAAAAVTR